MKAWLAAALTAVAWAGADAAWAAGDCEGAPAGDGAVIAVPKGKAVRVMYLRPGPYNNYVEVCTRPGPPVDWVMRQGEFANASDWYLLWEIDPQAADYQLNFFGGQVGDNDPEPWKGMRRTATAYGVTLDWYDATPAMPNTIVEVCLHDGKGAGCPVH
jgi:hypothetical protein